MTRDLRACGVKLVAQLLLNVCLAVLSGCRYGEVGREGIACDYVVKEVDAFARDFGKCGGGGEKSITPSDGSEPRHVTNQKFAK